MRKFLEIFNIFDNVDYANFKINHYFQQIDLLFAIKFIY